MTYCKKVIHTGKLENGFIRYVAFHKYYLRMDGGAGVMLTFTHTCVHVVHCSHSKERRQIEEAV